MSAPVIGQIELINKLAKFTAANHPQSILFVGENGCGKKHIAKWFAERLGFDCVIPSETVTNEFIAEMYIKAIPTVYVISLLKYSAKQQNVLLKLIEEPPQHSIIILTCENISVLLPTILNRVIKFQFAPYSVEDLLKYCHLNGINKGTDDAVYNICNTPGRINAITELELSELIKKVNSLIDKISSISLRCCLGFSIKIATTDSAVNKFDFNIFFRVLTSELYKKATTEKDTKYLKMYFLAKKALTELSVISVAKDAYLLSFLSKLWEAANYDTRRI